MIYGVWHNEHQAVVPTTKENYGACLPPGAALTLHNRAEGLDGLDAWRNAVRVIDTGLALRLGDLRDEVRMVHTKIGITRCH